MGRQKVTIDNLSREVMKIIDSYGDDLAKNVRQAAKEVANKGRTAITNKSKEFDERWGKKKYSSGWRVTEEKQKYSYTAIIHQVHQPGLTHLLEYGHAQWYGGRAKAYPHIEPVAEKLVADFSKEEIERIRNMK